MSNLADTVKQFGDDILREFAYFNLGNSLGSGISRHIFDHPSDPTKVIKIEHPNNYYQNVREWQIWQDFGSDPKIARWLAPCHSISYAGTFLVMEKAFDIQPDQVPKTLPKFLTDHKSDNFGVIGMGRKKRVVCRDYGYVRNTLDTDARKWKG